MRLETVERERERGIERERIERERAGERENMQRAPQTGV